MENNKNIIITISRQLGCGGAYIGQEIAKQLGIMYADREIINKAAEKLSSTDEEMAKFDEKPLTFWQSFFQNSAAISNIYIPPQIVNPIDFELFETEADIMRNMAKSNSAVIVGRCGFYALKDYPNHIKIFLFGSFKSRCRRIEKLYKISNLEAEKMILKSDKDRSEHCSHFTGTDFYDVRNYDLAINTTNKDIDKIAELIVNYVKMVLDCECYKK